MDHFDIKPEDLPDYNIDPLDINRVPNTKVNPGRNPEKIQVTLLRNNGKVDPLDEGQLTRHHITSDILAVHVQFGYTDGANSKSIFIN